MFKIYQDWSFINQDRNEHRKLSSRQQHTYFSEVFISRSMSDVKLCSISFSLEYCFKFPPHFWKKKFAINFQFRKQEKAHPATHVFTQPLRHKQDATQSQFLIGVKLVEIQTFTSPRLKNPIYPTIYSLFIDPVGRDCRIHRLHLCRGVRIPSTSFLDITLNILIVRLK